VAEAGFGRRVTLIAVAECRARSDPREAAGELRAIFVEQIGRKLVDGNDDEELGRGRPHRSLSGRHRSEQCRSRGQDESEHLYSVIASEAKQSICSPDLWIAASLRSSQ